MFTKILKKMKFLIIITTFYLVGCSKDISNLPLNEKAIYQSSRFSSDIPKDKYRKPLEVLEFSGIKPGMKVVDVLGGGGYYSELFNYIVGSEGKVILQNNSLFLRFSTKELEKRLKNNRLKNVVRLDSEYANLKLPKNVDMLFFGLSFHDFFVNRKDLANAIPEEFYKQIKDSLKPNGIIVLIDHAARKESGLADTRLHRIDEEWVKSDLESQGFKFLGSIDSLRNPNDDFSLDIWNKKVYHKTDRFIHKYQLVK